MQKRKALNHNFNVFCPDVYYWKNYLTFISTQVILKGDSNEVIVYREMMYAILY